MNRRHGLCERKSLNKSSWSGHREKHMADGRRVSCPNCGMVAMLPPKIDPSKTACPSCRKPLSNPPQAAEAKDETVDIQLPRSGGEPIREQRSGSSEKEGGKLPRRLGEYELLEVIGRGGMGLVYRARHVSLDRAVAVKVLRSGMFGQKEALRFVAEAQVTGQLEHPNIVPVHDIGMDQDGSPYFVMKLVRGKALGDILMDLRKGDAATAQEYPLSRLLNIFCEVCQAVAFAHSKGIIHRDLKPSNVMIGDYGEVQVMDWGLAKKFGTPETRTGGLVAKIPGAPPTRVRSNEDPVRMVRVERPESQDGFVAGTPEYMSPEQATGDPSALSPRSDIYSLGGLLFEMLSYRPPHMDRDTQILMHKVATVPVTFPSPGGNRPKVSKALQAVTMKALAFNQQDRYGSALALLQDVRSVIDHLPVTACPDTLMDMGLRLVRRNGALVATAGAALLLFSVGATAAFWNLEKAAREKATAQEEALEESARRESAEKERSEALKKQIQAEKEKGKLQDEKTAVQKRELEQIRQLARSMRTFPEALELIKRRQHDKAIYILQGIIHSDPRSPVAGPAYFYLGEAYLNTGQRKFAQDAILSFEAADSVARKYNDGIGSPRALLRAGETAWRLLDDPGKAREFYDKAAQADPANPYSMMGQAYAHVLRGREFLGDAKQDAANAEAKKALALSLKAARNGSFLWETHYVAGILYGDLELPGSGLKNLDKAYEHFSRALILEPNNFDLWKNRATIAQAMGRPTDALSDYSNALRLRPDALEAITNRAMLLASMHRLKEALEGFDLAIKLGAGHFKVRLHRGLILAELKNWKAAEPEFTKAIDLQEKDPRPWLQRARTRFALNNFQGAASDADTVLSLKPDFGPALRISAEAYLKADQPAKAVERFQRIVSKKKTDPEVFKLLGDAQLKQKNPSAAIQAYLKFLELKPDQKRIRLRMIQLLIKDPSSSEFNAAQAIDLAKEGDRLTKSNDPEMLVALAHALKAGGRLAAALKVIEAAYTPFPDHPGVIACRESLRKEAKEK